MRITLDLSTPEAWESVLDGVVRESVTQRRRGRVPSLSDSPHVKYAREPRGRERWQTAAETHRRGEGDCEDLACWLVADAIVRGIDARVVVRRAGRGKYHALALIGGKLVDPSKARGMGRRRTS